MVFLVKFFLFLSLLLYIWFVVVISMADSSFSTWLSFMRYSSIESLANEIRLFRENWSIRYLQWWWLRMIVHGVNL